jgi:hypothetical protein
MHSNPYILTRPGDYKQYFGRHQEGHHYQYNSEFYSCASDSEQLPRIGPEWQSMPTPVSLEPHENDVLMGRGGRNNQHSGNEILRQFARTQGEKYRIASKKGKSAISRHIVGQMRELNPPAR